MDSNTLRIVHRIIVSTACFAGFFINLTLIFLILTTKMVELKVYSKILLQIAVCDLVAMFFFGITQPITVVHSGNEYFLLNGICRFVSQPFNHIICMLVLFCHFFNLSSVAVQYLVRYFVICWSNRITGRLYACFLLFPVVLTSLHVSHAYFSFLPAPEDEKLATDALGPYLLESGQSTIYLGSVMKAGATGTFVTNTTSTAVVLITYGAVFFCMFNIRRKLKAIQHTFSEKTRNLQRCLTKVLIVQAATPFIFLIIPTLVITQASYLNQIFVVGGTFMTMIILWGPVANGFLTMFLIRPYRNRIIQIFKNIFKKPHEIRVSTQPPTSLSIRITNLSQEN